MSERAATRVLPAPNLQPRFAGFQPVAVEGRLEDRCLVTFRAPAGDLAPVVRLAAGSAPFQIDAFEGDGFLSVCAVHLTGMRIAGLPRALSFDNCEMLYRLGVRLPSGAPTFLTLRSDVSAPALAVLGLLFSHYRPQRAVLARTRSAGRFGLTCRARDGLGDADVEADLGSLSERCPSSRFPDAATAAAFLLGMRGSAAGGALGLRVQRIERGDWSPRFVSLRRCRFDYVDALGHRFGIRFDYDSTLHVSGVAQRWCAARLGGHL